MQVKILVDIGNIPETGDQWELYTCSMNCNKAARALTSALKKAIKACAAGASTSQALREHFDPVANKYAAYGAADSEPMHHAVHVLNRISAARERKR